MVCTYCGGKTDVKDTKHEKAPGGAMRTVRVRQCQKVETHRFKTVERAVPLTIHEVLVRRSGDKELAPGAFDIERLCRDVSNGVLKRLDEDQVHDVVRRAIDDLEAVMTTKVEPITEDEQRERPGYRYAIMDADIGRAVERRLRRRQNRLPHVLYALSTFGRHDRDGRQGFRDAVGVLHWMKRPENYPDLIEFPLPPRAAATTEEWRPVHGHLVPPRFVIKRRDGRRAQFGHEQFVASIRRAMIGRPDATRLSACVALYVLDEVSGQREVLSTQLATGVLTCLRRVDDIAYLRWAAVAKGMQRVTDFRDEALALLTQPSPRLVFPDGVVPTQRKEQVISLLD